MNYPNAKKLIQEYNPLEGYKPGTILRAVCCYNNYWEGRSFHAGKKIETPEPVGKPQVFHVANPWYLKAEIAKAQFDKKIPKGANAILCNDVNYLTVCRLKANKSIFSREQDFAVQFFKGSLESGLVRLSEPTSKLSLAGAPIVYRAENEYKVEELVLFTHPLGRDHLPENAKKCIIGEATPIKISLTNKYSFAVQFCKINPQDYENILAKERGYKEKFDQFLREHKKEFEELGKAFAASS